MNELSKERLSLGAILGQAQGPALGAALGQNLALGLDDYLDAWARQDPEAASSGAKELEQPRSRRQAPC